MVKGDMIEAMKVRSDLARASLPGKSIDADDWVLRNYEGWMWYTTNSWRLGALCIFYSEWFLPSMEAQPTTRQIPPFDLHRIAEVWRAAAEHPVAP